MFSLAGGLIIGALGLLVIPYMIAGLILVLSAPIVAIDKFMAWGVQRDAARELPQALQTQPRQDLGLRQLHP